MCKTPLHVLGLYPMSGPWAGGEALYPATQLAVEDVNNNPSILEDYDLKVDFADTKVSSSGGFISTDCLSNIAQCIYRQLW